MMRLGIIGLALVSAAPAQAAGDYPFFSLYNTDIVVAVAFVLFLGILGYFGVHRIIVGILDKRANTIRAELDEARSLREEAQQLLASYERKSREVETQAERIVTRAREEAQAAAVKAKDDLKVSIARRLQGAEDQIASAEAAAIRHVRNRAVAVAVAAAGEVLAQQMTADEADRLVSETIGEVEKRLN